MGSVRNAVRMVRDAAELDALAAHELTRRVVQHFVRIHVAVVVRSGYRFRVEIIRTRAEGANNEPVTLESLVDRRRLVHAPYDRLEVVNVERPRIEVAVPTHDVERVVVEHDLVDPVRLLD